MTDKLCYIIAEGLDSMRKYSKELYSKDVLMKAAYAFTDDVYVHLDCDNENYMVSVTSKLDESEENIFNKFENELIAHCLLYTSPSPRDRLTSRMPSSA